MESTNDMPSADQQYAPQNLAASTCDEDRSSVHQTDGEGQTKGRSTTQIWIGLVCTDLAGIDYWREVVTTSLNGVMQSELSIHLQ